MYYKFSLIEESLRATSHLCVKRERSLIITYFFLILKILCIIIFTCPSEILENGFNITYKFIHFVKNLVQVRYTLVTVSMVLQLSTCKCLKFEAVGGGGGEGRVIS